MYAGSAFIDNFHVRPDCKRRGIGRALMRFAATEMIRRGYTAAHLSVLEANVRRSLQTFQPTPSNPFSTFSTANLSVHQCANTAPCLIQLFLVEKVCDTRSYDLVSRICRCLIHTSEWLIFHCAHSYHLVSHPCWCLPWNRACMLGRRTRTL